jgi:circadian clock protein KaiB
MVRRHAALVHSPRKRMSAGPSPTAATWDLCLYIAGESPRARLAFDNLTRLCDDRLTGHYHIEVVDVKETPARAKADQIVALPTVVRRRPAPERKVIGTLADTEKTVGGLDLPHS